MGKGDKRSRRGKIFAGSYGKTRPKYKKPTFVASETPKAAPAEKPAKKRTAKRIPAAAQSQPAVEAVETPVETVESAAAAVETQAETVEAPPDAGEAAVETVEPPAEDAGTENAAEEGAPAVEGGAEPETPADETKEGEGEAEAAEA